MICISLAILCILVTPIHTFDVAGSTQEDPEDVLLSLHQDKTVSHFSVFIVLELDFCQLASWLISCKTSFCNTYMCADWSNTKGGKKALSCKGQPEERLLLAEGRCMVYAGHTSLIWSSCKSI